MKKIFLITGLICMFSNCFCQSNNSFIKKSFIDTIPTKPGFSMGNGDRRDSEQETPSLTEEKNNYLDTYNKIISVDTLFVIGKNTIKINLKYYCLKSSKLIIPKNYNWVGKKRKPFITHDFASSVLILKNADTLFNRVILKRDFNIVINDQLKDYAVLFPPELSKYNIVKEEIVLHYSISIPVTDLGTSVYLIINKNGSFKVLSTYE